MILLSFLIYLWSTNALGISEVNYFETYEALVKPFYESKSRSQYFKSHDALDIHYKVFLQEKPADLIVISPGRTENINKYDELIFDFYQLGYSIAITDPRGQGRSGRMLEDPFPGHVENFSDYAGDLKFFIDQVVKTLPRKKLFNLSHSMGSNISTLYSIENPSTFDKMVLSSPMIDINTGTFPEWFVYAVSRLLTFIGLGGSYMPSVGPPIFNKLYLHGYTHSVLRKRKRIAYENQFPNQVTGGPTNSWTAEAIKATWTMRAEAGRLQPPILLLQAGKDQVVLSEGQNVVCSKAKNCRLVRYDEAFHEILHESDSIRDSAIAEIHRFYSE